MSTTMRFRVREGRLYQRRVKTRFPFRFGKASMTEMPIVYLRLNLEAENGSAFEGFSASGVPPLWFDKRPGKTPADNENDLILSAREALEAYASLGLETAWNLHVAVTEPLRQRLIGQGLAGLAAGFGPALVEAACVDGMCRFHRRPLHAAVRTGTLGLPAETAASLPETPSTFIRLRHTVGLADALTLADAPAPLNDGLPETLEQVVRVTRARLYKVKISGDASETLPRLRRIAEILDRDAGNYSVTLDGNEQFAGMESFASFMETLRSEPAMQGFLNRVLWIEQPVQRDAALDPSAAAAVKKVAAFKPVIIDESDGEGDALDRALVLGYGGVSSKTCKGLFRSIAHHARLRSAGRGLIQSCEDLTTVPVLPLQQDLCLAATLGLDHAERNGHHYIRGFEFLSRAEGEDALASYPSLYETDLHGGKVRIANGGFCLDEVVAAYGLGSHSTPDWSALRPMASPLSIPTRGASA